MVNQINALLSPRNENFSRLVVKIVTYKSFVQIHDDCILYSGCGCCTKEDFDTSEYLR